MARMISIEEKFALIVGNYADYEAALLDLTPTPPLKMTFSYSWAHDGRILVNRRLANLLTATRMYVDQVDRDVKAVCGNEAAAIDTKAARSKEYDSRFGYRLMEALRNHVQHHDLPVGSMSWEIKRVHGEDGGAPRVRQSTVAKLDVLRLESNKDFKPTILAELRLRGRFVAITPLVREYVDGLAAAHGVVREKTGPHIEVAESILTETIEEAQSAWGTVVGLCVAVEADAEEWTDMEDIFPELAERRRELADRTRDLQALSRLNSRRLERRRRR
jgi:hypothetical protein